MSTNYNIPARRQRSVEWPSPRYPTAFCSGSDARPSTHVALQHRHTRLSLRPAFVGDGKSGPFALLRQEQQRIGHGPVHQFHQPRRLGRAVALLFGLIASGQIQLRRIDGYQRPSEVLEHAEVAS